jgi:four helix bundle protein
MFLELSHQKLDVYNLATELVVECYQLTNLLPGAERFNLIQQIRRAALSVKLNIAEGSSRKTFQERKRFFEISRSSITELDAAFEICARLKYLEETTLMKVGKLLLRCYQMLSKMT